MAIPRQWIPAWLKERPVFGYDDLREEIASMPVEERRNAEHDLHGMASQIVETPELLDEKLELFEEKLVTMDIPEREAYEMALFANPEYVASERFLLMFLRADGFDEEAAARRMVRYWDRKVDLFGTENAFRPLNFLLNFKEKDVDAVIGGGIRLLPHRDESGRAIIFSYRKYWDNRPENGDSMVRLLWYVVHSAIEDPSHGEKIQKNGFISLVSNGVLANDIIAPTHFTTSMVEVTRVFLTDTQEVLPMKGMGFHGFAPNAIVKLFSEHCMMLFGHHLRARFRLYDGTDGDNFAKLDVYGITPDMVPPELGGTLSFDYSHWLKSKYSQDAFILKGASSAHQA